MAEARIGVVSCAFTRFGCRSEHDLFSPSYTRSNKKRNAKLLRCFPHCCPNHVLRSYCGCSVHLLITFESSASATAADHNPDLVVSARFESTLTTAIASSGDVVTALAPGAMVALPANAMFGPNVTESDWIRASKASYAYQQQLPENTLLYELNDCRSPMWYYSYESGSTKTQREMKHVLAAYVFVLHPTAASVNPRYTGGRSSGTGIRLATVAARHPSPSFTMVSYRRHNKRSGSGQQRMTGADECAIKLEEMEVPMGYRFPSPVQLTKQGGLQRVISGINEDAAEDEAKHLAPTQSQEYARSESDPPVDEPTQFCCCLCQERMTLHTHSLQLQALDLVKQLLLLRFFVFATPLEAFSFYFNEMDSRIRSQWLFNIPPIRRVQIWVDDPADHTAIAEMKFTLTLADFVGDEETVKSSTSKLERVVLQSCADLLLDAFSSPRIREIFVSIISNLRRVGQDEALTRSKLCGKFSQMITDIYDELTQLLTADIHDANPFGSGQFKTYSSIPELVDDILSVIYSERRYEVLRGEVTALLLRRGDLFELIIQEVFRGFVTQTRATFCGNTDEECGTISAASRAASGWCRRWFVDPMSLLVVPIYIEISSVDTGSYPPRSGKASLLSTLALIRMLACVGIVLDGRRLMIQAAMSEVSVQLPGLSGTVLELDGDTHAFEALPSGLQSAAGAAVFGEFWGVKAYKGLAADSGMSLDVSLLMFSNIQANSRRDDLVLADSDVVVRKAHVTLVLNDTRDGCGDHLDVRAEVFELRFPSRQVNVASWQSSELFDNFLNITSEVKWLPTVEIAVTYVPVPQSRGGVS